MIANIVVGGIVMPKKAEALCFVDAIGGVSGILDKIQTGAKWVWEKSEVAWDKVKTIADLKKSTVSAISGKVSAAKAIWDKTNAIVKGIVKIAWSVTKKKMLDMLVNNIINWIQGGGSPRFVTDWKSFLQDSAGEAVGKFIESSVLAFLCDDLSVNLKIAIGTVPPFQRQVGCTLDDIEGNVKDFYNDINKGGWDGWLTVTQSNNNFQGVYWGALGEKMYRAAMGKEAAEAEAKSAGGFLSQKQCMEWDCSDGDFEECMSWGDTSEAECREAADCECVRQQIVTPGQTIASAASKAINLDIDWLLSAEEFEDYAGAILDAVVNRVTREGLGLMKTDGDKAKGAYSNQPYERQNVTKESAMFMCKASSGQTCMCLDSRNPDGPCRVDSKGNPIISFEQMDRDIENISQDFMNNAESGATTQYYNSSQSNSDTAELLSEFLLMIEKLRWQLVDALPYAQEEYETSEAMKFCAEYKYDKCGRVVPDRTLKFVQNNTLCTERCMAYVQSFFQCDTVPPLIQDPDAPLIPDPEWSADSENPAPLIKDPTVLIPDPKFVPKKCLCENRAINKGLCQFDSSDNPIVIIDQIPENNLNTILDECYEPIAEELESTFQQECDRDIQRDSSMATGYAEFLDSEAKLSQILDIADSFKLDKSIAQDLMYRATFHKAFDDCAEGVCSSSANFDLCEQNVLSKDGVCQDILNACQQGESQECQSQFEECNPEDLVEGVTCQSQFNTCKEIACLNQFNRCESDVSSVAGDCYEQEVKIDFLPNEDLEKCIVEHCVTAGFPDTPPNAICRTGVTAPAKEAVMAGGKIISPATDEGFCYNEQFETVNYYEVSTDDNYIMGVDEEAQLKEILNNKMSIYSGLSGSLEFKLQGIPLDGDKCFNGEEMPSIATNRKVNEYEREHFCITREMHKCAPIPWFKPRPFASDSYIKTHFLSRTSIIEKAIDARRYKNDCYHIGKITEQNSCTNCPRDFYYCDINTNGEEDGGIGWVNWWGDPANSGGVQIWNKPGGEWDKLFDIEVAPAVMQAIFDDLDS